MIPTAREVAAAIVAAARQTGADPIDVASGAERVAGCPTVKAHAIARARAYAARAIDRVFNRAEFGIARPAIARLVGANKPSWGAFFSSLDGRQISWWDEAVFRRVVDAVMDCEPEEKTQTYPNPRPPAEKPQADQRQAGGRVLPTICRTLPPPYKDGPLPPVRRAEPSHPLGHLEPGGYRPAPGTAAKVLEDDDEEPVFDRGALASRKPRTMPVIKSKREMAEDLARAVRNTAAKTPPPEE